MALSGQLKRPFTVTAPMSMVSWRSQVLSGPLKLGNIDLVPMFMVSWRSRVLNGPLGGPSCPL